MATDSIPNVRYKRPEVVQLFPQWKKIRDCLDGETAVKAAGEAYLPRIDPDDTSEENLARYESYLARAVFYNVTKRTHKGLIGQAYQKEPTIEVPGVLEPLTDNVDGTGVTLLQQSVRALGGVLGQGRIGMLTDFPHVAENTSRQDILSGRIIPSVCLYDPWQVINWRTTAVGSQRLLSLVVIEEGYEESDDGFEIKPGTQWRVLLLDPAAEMSYRVDLYRLTTEKYGTLQLVDSRYPLDKAGKPWKEIPFTFVGSENNDPECDQPPLYDLASLNIAHYRNSADYEESVHLIGQPTPVAAGLTKEWVKDVFQGKIHLGSRRTVPLPPGASFTLCQAQPNSLVKEAMTDKERQMVALGARIVEQRAVQRTLGEAKLEYATELSILGTCAKNVTAAYLKALEWAGVFIGTEEDSTFELYPDAGLETLSSQELQAIVAAWQAEAISDSEMRDNLKRGGVASLELEDWKDEVDSSPKKGLGQLGSSAVPSSLNGGAQNEPTSEVTNPPPKV